LKCDNPATIDNNANDNDLQKRHHHRRQDEEEEEECSSDTGLSSLSTSTEEGTYALTTLV
jgi:hypothetical protein